MIENYGENYNKEHIARANKVLMSEVETMDQYIRGDVYGFYLLKDGVIIDSCCGFYGEDISKNGMLDHLPTELISE
jgi:hypothetical protein